MRLICPNCDAEYEVDGSLLPPDGRDVQCSNCNNTWFQRPDVDEEALDLTPPAAAAGLTPQRPTTDPDALDIIHEEVERETRARQSESASIETQPDLGLDEAEANAAAERARIARDRGTEPTDEELAQSIESALAPAPRRTESAKKELFPDIEEINSTLASTPDPVYDEDGEATSPAAAKRSSGFRMGFGLMLMLTAALLALYVYAPALAERFPAMSGILESYVALIDRLRVALDAGAQWLLQKVTALTEQIGS